MGDPLEEDLDAYLAGMESDDDWEPPEHDTAADADTWLRRLGRARAEIDRIKEYAAAKRAPIALWEHDRLKGPQRLQETAERQLEALARAEHAASGGRTWKFTYPAGRLTLTRPRQSFKVDDEAAVLEWAQNADTDVRARVLKQTLMPSELKAITTPAPMSDEETEGADPDRVAMHATYEGEIIPGVHFEQAARPTFTPTPAKP